MNKIYAALLSLSLLGTTSISMAMEPMDKADALEKGTMSKDAMKKEPMAKEGAMMMKAAPKKMEKQNDKMEQGASMAKEPKK